MKKTISKQMPYKVLSRMTRSSSGRLYEERYSPLVRAMPTKAAKCVPPV